MFTAEMTAIALGLTLALGVFALKTAVGSYCYLALPGGALRKTAFLVLVQVLYLVLFLAAFLLLPKLDFLRFPDLTAFLKNGMLFHLLLCAGLFYWGARLLVRREGETPDRLESKGWLLLTVPCPVCASAVLLVCAFARMLFPEWPARYFWAVPLFFLLVNLFFLGGLSLTGKMLRIHPLALTGRMMILIALYFVLILLIAPQFGQAGKLYAAACASGGSEVFSLRHGLTAGIIVLAAAGGFCLNFLREKRS